MSNLYYLACVTDALSFMYRLYLRVRGASATQAAIIGHPSLSGHWVAA